MTGAGSFRGAAIVSINIEKGSAEDRKERYFWKWLKYRNIPWVIKVRHQWMAQTNEEGGDVFRESKKIVRSLAKSYKRSDDKIDKLLVMKVEMQGMKLEMKREQRE